MAWIVGIDEAGYGPNLGPFVMSAVTCRVPDALIDADLWQTLRSSVRRHRDRADNRLLVDDSKLVYSTAQGLAALEMGVLATVASSFPLAGSLTHYVACACASAQDALRGECWYSGQTSLPVNADPHSFALAATAFRQDCQTSDCSWAALRSVVVVPSRFNELVERTGSKGAVLAHALAELLGGCPNGTEPTIFYIDKHGGRNHYAAMLQDALPDGTVIVQEEGQQKSVYRVLGLEREVRLTFQPRADTAHLCVALASMASKYLRELLMLEFNSFWQGHVPGLKATAGYPGDAARFYAAIRPVAERLGIPERALWRHK